MEELCLDRVLSQGQLVTDQIPPLLASSTERTEGRTGSKAEASGHSPGLPTDQQRGAGGTEQLLQGDGQNQGSGRYRDHPCHSSGA